jgi:glycolate oxidase
MDKKIIQKLKKILGRDNLLTAAEECSCYGFDSSKQNFMPDAVALPSAPEQLSKLLKLASQYHFPVVARGAGSGMTGGALPVAGGLVIGFSRMNRILEIDRENMIAVVEPGVITGELQAALKPYGLMYPPDPASLKFCTLGGNAAECAGGPSAVKYGVTRDYIIGCRAVTATGEIITTGMRTEKGVTGYDLTHLLIGSEGTLAIFTSLTLRLLPLPEARETLLLLCTDMVDAVTLVAELLRTDINPCTLEYMDQSAIAVVRDLITLPLDEKIQALLLLELDGTAEEVAKRLHTLHRFLKNRSPQVLRAASESERTELWQARRAISPAAFKLKPDKISEDVVVPRSRIPELVAFTTALARELDLIILTFGHAGDGNIHVNIMLDRSDPDELEHGLHAKKRLFTKVMELGGTLSGEHGIGTTKAAFLPLEIDPPTMALMKKIKKLFDPNNILNPGKIFPLHQSDGKHS